jgi:hypothetical protein
MANKFIPIEERIYLNVPFTEKNEAKEMGCRWDPDRKKWYCGSINIVECVSRWGNNFAKKRGYTSKY